MGNMKDKARFAAIKATSVALGTAYILCKAGAEGFKNLEANIIHKLDPFAEKVAVRRHRMESYFTVMNQVTNVHDKINERAELIKQRLLKRATTQEILLMDQERLSHVG